MEKQKQGVSYKVRARGVHSNILSQKINKEICPVNFQYIIHCYDSAIMLQSRRLQLTDSKSLSSTTLSCENPKMSAEDGEDRGEQHLTGGVCWQPWDVDVSL